jgi:polyhydroxyalkanoate synthesis repressor PhaR
MATARKKAAPTTDQPTGEAPAKPGLRILKKYPNRRLYDTQTSSYITLADVKRMVLDGVDFEVHDAKTQEDLTRSILLQIILEEETGGVPMFSTSSLAQIIRFYCWSARCRPSPTCSSASPSRRRACPSRPRPGRG